MATHLSGQHALNAIKLIYEETGFLVPNETLGAAVTKEFGEKALFTDLAALYLFVDEFIALFRYSEYYFMSGISSAQPRAVTFYRLSVRQAKNLSSIRLLCSNGLDTNARMLLRLLYETSILWSRFLIDDECRQQFDDCTDPEKSNRFWHKYLAKEKSEKFLLDQNRQMKLTWLGNLKDEIGDVKLKLSLAAHPTFLTAYFDSVSDFHRNDEFAIGEPKTSSHFTLNTALLLSILPFTMKPEIGYGLKCVDLREKTKHFPPVSSKQLNWDEYNQALRDLFPLLWGMSQRFADGLRNIS